MNEDVGRRQFVTRKHRYILVYLIFKPQSAHLLGRTVECYYGADCLEDITKREAQLKCTDDYVGIVGLQNFDGNYI